MVEDEKGRWFGRLEWDVMMVCGGSEIFWGEKSGGDHFLTSPRLFLTLLFNSPPYPRIGPDHPPFWICPQPIQ